MKGSELIKKAIEPNMPDMEDVRKKCIEELCRKPGEQEKAEQKRTGWNMRRGICAGVGICAAVLLCAISLSAHSGAESFIAHLQTWLHIGRERVEVGEMKKASIRIPEDCEEVEYGGEKYLTKSYASVEELEKDIGKHLDIWRKADGIKELDIVLNIVEGKYAKVSLFYSSSKIHDRKFAEYEDKIRNLKYCITIPLSEDFSMDDIKLKGEFLKDAILNGQGDLIDYNRDSDYTILETYHSKHLDVDISVLRKRMEDTDEEQEDVIGYPYYYLYFVYKGLSYQINSNSSLEAAKRMVEELE